MSPRMRLGAWIAAGVLGGGLVTGVALSAIGTATAASPNPSASPAPYGGFGERMRGLPPLAGPDGGPGPGFGLGIGGPDGKVLHSQATVQKSDGTTEVVVSQTGDITDVTDSTITVKSSDGYEATYTIDKNTRISLNGTDGTASSLKKGDTVRVIGTKSGSTAHADAVMDGMTSGFMMFRHNDRIPPRPQASPNTSSSSST